MKHFAQNLYGVFRFDAKTAGFTYFVPALIWFVSLLIILFVRREGLQVYNHIIVIQGIFIPFSGWCLMYRLREMYEEGAQDTLIPYYLKQFPFDFSRYFIVNLFGVGLLVSVFSLHHDISMMWPINVVHFVLLVLFFMFFGTALLVTIKNIEISLTIILIYVVLEVATLGDYMPWPHIFLFEKPVWGPFLQMKLTILTIAIIILMSITTVFIQRADRKPQ